ncbi:MAG: hypothetical protein CO103_02630 [Chloroflexi bacterium CG_4_9_14_3_um_filter_45_9]|nr:MAG: hypothetical protein CO103_02630 [Chloroflexi bacterium CG_4_9_14_3_um_filter_45_9]
MHKQLEREGHKADKHQVVKLMMPEQLAGKIRRRFKRTTKSAHGQRVAPNRLKPALYAGQQDAGRGVRGPMNDCPQTVGLRSPGPPGCASPA